MQLTDHITHSAFHGIVVGLYSVFLTICLVTTFSFLLDLDAFHPHHTSCLATCLLSHTIRVIDTFQHPFLIRSRIVALAKERFCSSREEGIVEGNDFVCTTEVGVERDKLGFHIPHIVVDILQQTIVATTKSIDTLLHIAHQQATVTLSQVTQQ